MRRIKPAAILVSALTAVLIGLTARYRYCETQRLRRSVYKPLSAELTRLETCLNTATVSCPTFASSIAEVLRERDFARVPAALQQEIMTVEKQESAYETLLFQINSDVDQQVSVRIKALRSVEADRAWMAAAIETLHTAQREGDAPIRRTTLERPGRAVAWDLQNADHPKIIAPGGPIWQLDDYLDYPRTLIQIEACWTDVDFLYFDDSRDKWFYRITRADLEQHQLTLKQFGDPIYAAISTNLDFQGLPTRKAALLNSARSLQKKIADATR